MEMENKDAYLQKIDAQIKEVDARIDLLNSRIKQLDADIRMAYEDDYNQLFSEKEALKNEMIQIRNADESTWEKLKMDFEEKWNSFKENLDSFVSKI